MSRPGETMGSGYGIGRIRVGIICFVDDYEGFVSTPPTEKTEQELLVADLSSQLLSLPSERDEEGDEELLTDISSLLSLPTTTTETTDSTDPSDASRLKTLEERVALLEGMVENQSSIAVVSGEVEPSPSRTDRIGFCVLREIG